MPVGGMSRAACTQEHVATPGRMTTKYIDTMEYVTLNNGVKMPQMGYGVYQVDPKECERCVSDAISVGYRLIDTAQAYHNEEGVGEAIAKCGVPRGELFIVARYGYPMPVRRRRMPPSLRVCASSSPTM